MAKMIKRRTVNEYPRCPRCGGSVVAAMMTSRSVEIGLGRYYHPDGLSVYCCSGSCNYDVLLEEIPYPPRREDDGPS